MEILYSDRRMIIVIKPAGVQSTNVPGGMTELIRRELGDDKACVRPVHRLDQAVSGVMVYARSAAAAKILSQQIADHTFHKQYLAVIHGTPKEKKGALEDLLFYDTEKHMSEVRTETGENVKKAVLSYEVLDEQDEKSLVIIQLHTGRTHQIRVQFSSRGFPLVGDRKYGIPDETANIALWSYSLAFCHPQTEEPVLFHELPPDIYPWNLFYIDALTSEK